VHRRTFIREAAISIAVMPVGVRRLQPRIDTQPRPDALIWDAMGELREEYDAALIYQNTVQFGKDLDRVDLFSRMGLRSCQLTYNTKNHVGVGCWEDGGWTADRGRGARDGAQPAAAVPRGDRLI
jgi:membrane dipeptidase (peptidase family M19)